VTPIPSSGERADAQNRRRCYAASTIALTGLLAGASSLLVSARPPAIATTVLLLASLPAMLLFAAGAIRILLQSVLRPMPSRPRGREECGTVPLVVPVILRRPSDVALLRACVDANLPMVAVRPMLFLIDGADAAQRDIDEDAAMRRAVERALAVEIASGDVALLERARRYDAIDDVWRGWERKRGKIEEFCRLCTGDADSDFVDPLPDHMRGTAAFVTIDVDTRLKADTMSHLVAGVDDHAAIVVPAIEDVRRARPNLFERLQAPFLFTRPFDPPEGFNQEVLGRGIFYGKGLIVVSRFLERTRGSIPERTVLSHDHLESMLAGAVSIPTAVVREEVPHQRDHWERRQHRWIRGDLQIAPWILIGPLSLEARLQLALIVANQMTALGAMSILIVACVLLPLAAMPTAMGLVLLLFRPTLPLLPLEAVRLMLDPRFDRVVRLRRVGASCSTELAAWLLALAHGPRDAAMTLHAAALVLWRRSWSGRDLLAWSDAAVRRERADRWRRSAVLWLVPIVLVTVLPVGRPTILILGILLWSLMPVLLEIEPEGRRRHRSLPHASQALRSRLSA